jgi:uncharacterized protein involved in outer membrane biogenesis
MKEQDVARLDRMIRRIVIAGLALLGCLVLAAGIAAAVLIRMDWRPKAESVVSARVGRQVTIQGLTVGWGNPLRLELTGVHVANPTWASRPDMMSIDRAYAEIRLWPLLHGEYSLNNIELERAVLALERNTDGTGNWVTHPDARRHGTDDPPERLPVQFIAGMTLHEGEFTFMTSSHHQLRIHVVNAALAAADAAAPVNIHADGSYNDLPLDATIVLESFDALRQVPRPVAADIGITAPNSALKFNGTMTDPLNVDGSTGTLDLTARTLEDLSKLAGTPDIPNTKLALTGTLDRRGDQWRWTNLTGSFAATTVAGMLGMDEGGRGEPDHLTVGLDLGELDVRPLVAGISSGGQQSGVSLHVQEKPGETYAIKLQIEEALYRPYKFNSVGLEAQVEPSRVVVDKLSFGFADGRVELSAIDEAAGERGHLRLNAEASELNASQLLTIAGADASTLAGRLNAGLVLEMTGKTIHEGLSDSGGQLMMAMAGGQISRGFLRLASTDPRILFDKTPGYASLVCLLAIANVHNGVASVTPLRLRTNAGYLFGAGEIDLRRDSIDLLLRSDSRSFWALDIPLHITGSLSLPHALPAFGVEMARFDVDGVNNLRMLPPRLRELLGGRC